MEKMVAAVAGALIASVMALMVRRTNPEIALVIGAAGAVWLLFTVLPVLGETVDFLKEMLPEGAAGEVFPPLLRAAGIAILSRMGAELCRDAGEGAMAMKLELIGGVLAFAAAMPVFSLLIDQLQEMGR